MDKKFTQAQFLRQIQEKGRRKAKRREDITIWAHLGTLGVIGWAISLPTLMGTALGWYMDKKFLSGHRWTLAFLVLGLLMGCWHASYWVSKQCNQIGGDKEDDE